MSVPKPVILCILDGWGLRKDTTANAPALANTPTFNHLMASCPNATLLTHGLDVGLPKGQMGNSEVGHTNIGAGRIVAMDLGQIDLAIEDGSFFENPALLDFITKLKQTGGTAHLMGVLSNGGVHGHIHHMQAAVSALTDAGIPVAVHMITDGRDVAPKSALKFLEQVGDMFIPGLVWAATITGRYFALDRDNRWERVKTAFDAIALGKGPVELDPLTTINNAYDKDISDEFIPATVIGEYKGFFDGDGLFCLNFRADRAREILAAFGDPEFCAFETGERPELTAMLGMADYSKTHDTYMTTCYPKPVIKNTLGHWVAKQGLTQFRIAETEKYPHVTFFLNGGIEDPESGEDRHMPQSPKVATYDLQPEMSAAEVTKHLIAAIKTGYDLIVVNYANPDMVGHTGDLGAAIKACEAVDQGLAQVVVALKAADGAMIVTADHGNCETMIDPQTGGPHTAHTTNPVPVLVFGAPQSSGLRSGRLADLSPTLLELMGLAKPPEMTGKSLLTK
ncbi:MAG: 2,3-bisphosphoglycerate-independent phosphoglycerate mutase [Paracoccaceae bacterium]